MSRAPEVIVEFCPTHFVELAGKHCPKCQKEVVPATVDDLKKTIIKTTVYLLDEKIRTENLLEEVNKRLESEA